MNKDSMIKRYTKQIVALVRAAFLIVSILPAGKVEAASKIKYDKKVVAYYLEKDDMNFTHINITGLTKKQKVKNVTSSNSSVVTVDSTSGQLKGIKKGTAKVIATMEYGGIEYTSNECTVNVTRASKSPVFDSSTDSL